MGNAILARAASGGADLLEMLMDTSKYTAIPYTAESKSNYNITFKRDTENNATVGTPNGVPQYTFAIGYITTSALAYDFVYFIDWENQTVTPLPLHTGTETPTPYSVSFSDENTVTVRYRSNSGSSQKHYAALIHIL